MKITRVAAIAAIALVVGVVAQVGFGQAEQSVFEGDLVAVDAEAETITVENAENVQMTFSYDAETQVVGSDTTVQGLSGQSGTSLRVVYSPGENPMAHTIVLLEGVE